MVSMTFAALWAHKRRLTGAFFAVFLGVSFLAGTLMLGDTLSASIDKLFQSAYGSTDVVVRNAVSISDEPGSIRGSIDRSVVDTVRGVPGVDVVEPVVQGSGQIVGKDGKAVEVQGPRVAGNWVENPDLNAYQVVEGRAPAADDEVVVNKAAAEDGSLAVGDRTTVLTPTPVSVTVVGISRFGSEDAFGGTSFTAFTLAGAERWISRSPDRITSVSVAGAGGVDSTELRDRIRAALPPGTEAVTGSELAEENFSQVQSTFLDLFRTFLLVFAGVALLVGTFSIYNTFSIIVAQRARESALYRAVGALRSQLLVSVVLEALVIGLVAGLAGIAGGIGFVTLLKALFTAFGLGLPAQGLVVTVPTVLISLLVGLVVTLVAGIVPARRASRVPPIAALRAVAVEDTTVSRRRVAVGGVATAAGVGLAVAAVAAGNGALAGIGAVLTVVGVVVLGPVAARPVAAALGTPLRVAVGITGELARQNAMRSPRRIAGAATALMVGVTAVTLLTVVADSLKQTTVQRVSAEFGGDLAIDGGSSATGGFSTDVATRVGRLPDVEAAVGLGIGRVQVDGDGRTLQIADLPQVARVLALQTEGGSSLAGVGGDQLAVSDSVADDKGWQVGSTVPVRFPDGAIEQLRVGAVYGSGQAVGDYLLPRAAWSRHTGQLLDSQVLINLAPGADVAAAKARVTEIAKAEGAPPVRDRQEYLDQQTAGQDQLLGLVYVMLALAILIALLGIANTLSLSINERVRELGMLRAIGATRRQVRAVIRWESLIVSLFGTAGGLGLGLFLGWVLTRATSADDTTVFSAPVVRLLVVLLVGCLAGVLAAVLPARRAARLNPLRAIATA